MIRELDTRDSSAEAQRMQSYAEEVMNKVEKWLSFFLATTFFFL